MSSPESLALDASLRDASGLKAGSPDNPSHWLRGMPFLPDLSAEELRAHVVAAEGEARHGKPMGPNLSGLLVALYRESFTRQTGLAR